MYWSSTFESYYSQDYSLRVMSPPEYILDPQFQVTLLAAYDIEKWPAPRIFDAKDIPGFLAEYSAEETLAVGHNFLFDGAILAWRYGWVPARMACTMGMARALLNIKRYSLGAVAKEVLGHDSKGDVIHKVKGLDAQGIKNKGLWPDYRTYAMHDARLCAQIYARLYPEFPAEERLVMDLVLRAAIEPVLHADVTLLRDHLETLRADKAKLLASCGYDKAALMSSAQFQKALEDLGVVVDTKPSHSNPDNLIPALAKTDAFMGYLLEHPDHRVQTLAAARLSHKSTLEETRAERFYNIARLPWGNGGAMLPVPLRYGGAHTGRLSGEWQINMQNLPRDQSKSKLRQALLAPPGHKLIAADLSQIEARIVAALCKEKKLLEDFRAGQDVYASFATKVFNRPVNKNDQPFERFIGKTAVLGLGYGCGAIKFYQMVQVSAKQAGIPLDTKRFNADMARDVVDTYREEFAGIPKAWNRLDHAWSTVVRSNAGSQVDTWGPCRLEFSKIILPNRMALRYTPGDPSIYGAKLLENITQALARIVIMRAALRLAEQGYRWILQAHDELVFAVPEGQIYDAKDLIHAEMIQVPDWLPELPLAAEVKVGANYGAMKDEPSVRLCYSISNGTRR